MKPRRIDTNQWLYGYGVLTKEADTVPSSRWVAHVAGARRNFGTRKAALDYLGSIEAKEHYESIWGAKEA